MPRIYFKGDIQNDITTQHLEASIVPRIGEMVNIRNSKSMLHYIVRNVEHQYSYDGLTNHDYIHVYLDRFDNNIS